MTQRRLPPIDLHLGLLALAFAVLCWASTAWAIDPQRSEQSAVQATAVLAGALLFLACPRLTDVATERLFHTLVIATLLGTAILVVDTALHYKLQMVLLGRPHADPGAKYNRGIDHLVVIAWPQLAFMARRRDWRRGVLLAGCLATIVAIGLSLAAQAAAVAGLLVLAAAWRLPRAIAPLAAGGTILFVGGLPIGLRLMAEHRLALSPYLKHSGLHRLEIWDFMTARVSERPLLGWGIANSSAVPVTEEELSHYVVQHDRGIYPHSQWLQLWVETGAVGAAIGLTFVLLVLRWMQRLARDIRPFAYAAFASAVTISCVNFEVMTDSWWAAMAATGYLFAAARSHDAVVSA